MAKTQQKGQTTLPIPGFRNVDKEAAVRAQAALAGGKQDPLTPPKGAKRDTGKNGVTYTRWTEKGVIQKVYRSTTEKGLLDAAVVVKIRQSPTKENTGKKAWGHFYMNVTNPESVKGHEEMNDRSNGAIISLLQATGFMPKSGVLTGAVLDKMFPPKDQPGTSSPLDNKAVIVNIVQEYGPQRDRNTRKPLLDEDGDPIMGKRDGIESFLPETATTAADVEDEDDDEDDEDEDEDDVEEEDQDDDSEEDEESEEDDEEEEGEEEEDETPPPPPAKKKVKR